MSLENTGNVETWRAIHINSLCTGSPESHGCSLMLLFGHVDMAAVPTLEQMVISDRVSGTVIGETKSILKAGSLLAGIYFDLCNKISLCTREEQ